MNLRVGSVSPPSRADYVVCRLWDRGFKSLVLNDLMKFRDCHEQLCSGAEALFPAAAFMVQCGGFCPYPKIAVPLSLTRIYEVAF